MGAVNRPQVNVEVPHVSQIMTSIPIVSSGTGCAAEVPISLITILDPALVSPIIDFGAQSEGDGFP